MLIHVYTDGASRSNPGKSASGYRLTDASGKLLFKESFYNGIKTNNEAEYLALIAALKTLREKYGLDTELDIYSDSELMVKQINGLYKVKDSGLKVLNAGVKQLLASFKSHKITNVPRENKYITMVDKDLNILLDEMEETGSISL